MMFHQLLTASVTYKWKVTTNGMTNNQFAIFNAVDAGSVTINTLPLLFEFQFYTFGATYTQSQGIKVKDYTFNLYDNSDVLVQTSGLLLGATPAFEFTGMDNNTTYKVECQVTNHQGIGATEHSKT